MNTSLIESTAEVLDDMSKCLMIDEFLGNFFGALFAPIFFSSPLLWAEKAVNFLNREGQKRGATHSPRQSVLVLYVAQQCQNYKNVTL